MPAAPIDTFAGEARRVADRLSRSSGGAVEVRLLPVVASHRHATVVCADGARLFLKCMANIDALYGADGRARLRAQTAALGQLSRVHPVLERVIEMDGEPFVEDESGLWRGFVFIEHTAFDVFDSARVATFARALRWLHVDAATQLSGEVRAALDTISFAYPLAAVIEQPRLFLDAWDALVERSPSLASIASARDDVLHVLHQLPQRCGTGTLGVVHLDAHPDNVLSTADGVAIVDCDHLMIHFIEQCEAFAVLRLAQRRLSAGASTLIEAIDEVLRIWAPATGRDHAALQAQLLPWMVHVEVEKICRITRRTHETGAYGAFVDAIATRHYPTVQVLSRHLTMC